jgi:hypothetical protein
MQIQIKKLQNRGSLSKSFASLGAKLRGIRSIKQPNPFSSLALVALSFLIVPSQTVLAQSTTGKIEEAAKKIGEFLQQLGLIALIALLPAGCFVLMFGGFSDTQRATGVRILVFSILGVLGLLLFAQPIADFIGETFKPA